MDIQPKRNLKQGETVYSDDIADIKRLRFKDVEIPDHAGVLYLFSVGWRKGLYFDYTPIVLDQMPPRDHDLATVLAQCHAYLFWNELFKLTEADWSRLFQAGWFPFISLRQETLKKIISCIRNEWNVDELLLSVREEVVDRCTQMRERWCQNRFVATHAGILGTALSRYIEKDYVSSISVLFPRIEGIMRDVLLGLDPTVHPTQGNLVRFVISRGSQDRHAHSMLLPMKFRRFLSDVYFAGFDPRGGRPLSRHSVAHGVVDEKEFSLKGATIGFLVLEQLCYYLT